MKVLVTGAAGFIGGHIVSALVKEGSSVKVLLRPTADTNRFDNAPVETAYADITDRRSLHGIADGVDIIYHLAAQIGKWGIGEKRFQSTNVQGTRNLLEESARSGVKQFIFASTPGVQGKGHIKAQESMPYNPPYPYERSKCEAEKLVMKFYLTQNLPVTIIRPDFVYGPGDFRRLVLYKAIKKNRFIIIGRGDVYLHPTYIEDVVQGFLLAADNPIAFGQIYNMAGPHLINVQDYVSTIAKILGASPPKLKMPKILAVGPAAACEILALISGREPFISRSKIEFLTNSHGCDISKIKSQLGFRPKFNFRQGMQRTIDWYKQNGLI